MHAVSGIWGLLWRSMAAGLAYVVALVATGMVFGILGFMPPADSAEGGALLPWIFLSGVLMAAFVGPLARGMPVGRSRHLLVWTSVIFFNLASVGIEGAYFAPDLMTMPLPAFLAQQLVSAVIAALLITSLFAPKQGADSRTRSKPGPLWAWYGWLWRLLAGSATYLLAYAVFGLANYELVTRPYYESHAGGLTVPEGWLVWAVESVRAPMIVLSILPFILFYPAGRKRLAILSGLLLFWVGGIVPLVFQAAALPPVLILASAVEIFLQNFSTGAVVALLFFVPPLTPDRT